VELELSGYTTPFDFGTFIGFLDSHCALEFVDLDIGFTEGSVWLAPVRKVPLVYLRHFSLTCSEAIDSKGLLSCITPPRGVRLEVFLTKPGPSPEFNSLLPSSLAAIRELLHPISTIKTQFTPPMLQLSGNSSFISLTALGRQPSIYSGISLFSTSAVQEFHVDIHPNTPTDNRLSWVLERLPALETLVIAETALPLGALRMLAREPVLCPSLKTIVFFNCDMQEGVIKELGDAIATRKDLFATRLYRVIIINSTAVLPNLQTIQRLRRLVPCVELRIDDKIPDLL
jgi:hypothetical protein